MLEDFGAQAEAAGIETEILDFDDPINLEPRDVPQFARCFDLIVVEQVSRGVRRT